MNAALTNTPKKPKTASKAPAKKAAPAKKSSAAATKKKTVASKAVVEKALAKAPAAAKPVAPAKKAPVGDSTAWQKKPVDELTDADVLAMPESEYMNATQLAFFRLRLTRLRDSILANADKTTARLRKDTVVVPDPADRATIEEEHALELRTRDRERKLLKKIDQSISRIDVEDYGYCDETGEEIGVARLLARPTATLSLEAQERRELKQKMFGD